MQTSSLCRLVFLDASRCLGERVSDLMRPLVFVFLLNIATMSRQSPRSGPQRRQSTDAAPFFVCLADAVSSTLPGHVRRVSSAIDTIASNQRPMLQEPTAECESNEETNNRRQRVDFVFLEIDASRKCSGADFLPPQGRGDLGDRRLFVFDSSRRFDCSVQQQ